MRRAVPAARLPSRPTLTYERQLWQAGHHVVAGVDEAGRGAWAGPLVAAAVALPRSGQHRARISRQLTSLGLQIRDSKQLSPEARREIVLAIRELHVPCSVVEVPPTWLDGVGLGMGNRVALRTAVTGLVPRAGAALVDAFHLPECAIEHHALVHGDQRSLSIALASIIAKDHRDRRMAAFDLEFPGYNFSQNKGYGTAGHRDALAQLGVCALHRRCFEPVLAALGDG